MGLANLNEPTAQAQQLRDAGHQALASRCDVADEQEVAAMAAQTVATFGRLDAAQMCVMASLGEAPCQCFTPGYA